MDAITSAEACASANDTALPPATAALVRFLAEGLTPQMAATLQLRQQDMFGRDLLAGGYPIVIKALQRRGLVDGTGPGFRITILGEHVAAAIEGPSAVRPATPNSDAPAIPVAGVSLHSPIGHLRSGQSLHLNPGA